MLAQHQRARRRLRRLGSSASQGRRSRPRRFSSREPAVQCHRLRIRPASQAQHLPRDESQAPREPTAARAPSDPFALDARLVDAIRVIQTSEPRIGRLLGILVDHRLYRTLGFPSLDSYVCQRLGISARKVWALLKIEKTARRATVFAESYAEGRLSWARALTLLPVVDRDNAAAWINRATSVTVRRLADEVSWVLERRDALGADAPLDPPPLDSEIPSPVAETLARQCQKTALAPALQIGAHTREVCDVEIDFTAPASVVALFRDTLDAFALPGEPRWTALERVLQHVIVEWERAERHRDPVFARDGWRCTVPACTSRRNLHDHHVRYRSRGGGNERANRITICASHHLHGIHGGTIRAYGTAPRGIHWQLGVRAGVPPLLACVGDRICEDLTRPTRPDAAWESGARR